MSIEQEAFAFDESADDPRADDPRADDPRADEAAPVHPVPVDPDAVGAAPAGPDAAAACVEPVASDVEPPAVPVAPVVEIRASARRRRTVTAYREGDRTIVLVPARMSLRERERHAAELVERLERREARGRRSDADLMRRARQLADRYLDGAARPASVRWVGNQRTRWGSCTPLDGSIRLSDRMQGMPAYVVDAVLVHELAHLIHADHGPAFQALVARFPDHDRAQAYLEGVTWAQQHAAPPPS